MHNNVCGPCEYIKTTGTTLKTLQNTHLSHHNHRRYTTRTMQHQIPYIVVFTPMGPVGSFEVVICTYPMSIQVTNQATELSASHSKDNGVGRCDEEGHTILGP